MRLATRIAVSAAVLFLAVGVYAEEEGDSQGTVVKTRQGLNFQLPEDWPLEKRGGTVGPVPIEEYLGVKFAKLESRLAKLEKQMTELQTRMGKLEGSSKQPAAKLQSGEAKPPSH